MSVLSGFSRRLDAVGDRVNPIVMKETRQAVRSRAVVAVLSLFIVVLLIAAMGILLLSDMSRSDLTEGVGWETFLLFNGILLVVCGVFVPIYVAIRAAGDRSGVAADLLFTTTIRPVSVIWGKLAAGMLVTMLLFATAAPFVTVSYLLRGIDLPTIAYWLAFDALVIFLAIQAAVFVAVIPTSIVIRIILGVVAMVLGFIAISSQFAYINFMGETSVSVFDRSDWVGVITITSLMLLGAGTLFVLSVACVSPTASNRAFLPRLFITIAILLSYVVMLFACAEFDEIEPMLGWFFGWFVVLLLATLISSGERRDPGMRVLQSRLMRRRLTRPIGFLLSSNAFAGLAWCAVITGALILGLIAASEAAKVFAPSGVSHWGDWGEDVAEASIIACTSMIMAIAYNLFAIALRDGPLKRFSKGTVMTPAITMLLIAAVSVLPVIAIAMLGGSDNLDSEGISLLNPVSALIWVESDMQGLRLIIGVILLIVSLLCASGPLGRSIRAYRDGLSKDDALPVAQTAAITEPHAEPEPEEPRDA